MINIPRDDGNITPKKSTNNKDLLDTLKEETKTFSWTLEFAGLDYEARREKVEDINDELLTLLYKENINKLNILMRLLKEIIKNCADHSDSNASVTLEIIRDNKIKTVYIKFFIDDEGPGFPFPDKDIHKIFSTEKKYKNRTKKGNKNYGIGLSMIKQSARLANIDLIVHNKGNIYPIHYLGLQTGTTTKEKFGYEGFGAFDIIK